MALGADLDAAWRTTSELASAFVARLPLLVLALAVAVVFVVAGSITRRITRRATKDRERANLGIVLGRLLQGALILAGIVVAATIAFPGVDAGSLVALLGLSSVAIGFAFKDILQNFLAGLLLLVQEPFRRGDQIQRGDIEGTVQAIEARATKIETYDGRLVVVPNAMLYTDAVTVHTAFERLRSEYDVGVTYDVSSKKAREELLDAVREVEGVLDDPAPEALVVDLAPSTMNVRVRWWTRSERTHVTHTRARVLAAIKDHMAEREIDLPFPIRTVILRQGGGDGGEGWDVEREPRLPRGGSSDRASR